MQPERRKQTRVPINNEFRSVLADTDVFALDLSEDGVFLRTDQALEVGSTVRVNFSVLADDVSVFDLQGRVTHRRLSHPRGVGVQFEDLSPRSRQQLRGVLKLSTLRNRWEEGGGVTREQWDKAQHALASPAAASRVEFSHGAASLGLPSSQLRRDVEGSQAVASLSGTLPGLSAPKPSAPPQRQDAAAATGPRNVAPASLNAPSRGSSEEDDEAVTRVFYYAEADPNHPDNRPRNKR